MGVASGPENFSWEVGNYEISIVSQARPFTQSLRRGKGSGQTPIAVWSHAREVFATRPRAMRAVNGLMHKTILPVVMQKGELDCSLFYATHNTPTFYPIKYTWQNGITYGLAITCCQRHKCVMASNKRRYSFNLLLLQSKSKDFSTQLDCCSLLRAENC